MISIAIPGLASEPLIRFDAKDGHVDVEVLAVDASEAMALGLGYDSNQLVFERFVDLDRRSLLGRSARPERDRYDADSWPATDRVMRLVWLDPATNDQPLARLRFRAAARNNAEPIELTVFPLSTHRSFEARRHTPEAEPVALAIPRKQREPDPEPLPRALRKMAEPCSPDIDGNGELDGLTDGLLMVRHLFGLTGSALTDGAIGAGAIRPTAPQIRNFLQSDDCRPMLDADGSGSLDALSDGLLFARFLFGFSGESLVEGVIGPDATRRSGDDVDIWLSYYENPRFVVAEGVAEPGREVTDIFQDLRIRAVGDAPITARVVEGRNRQGEGVFNFEIDGEAEIDFVDPNRDVASRIDSGSTGYHITREWASGRSIFLWGPDLRGVNRIPGRRYDGGGFLVVCVIRDTHRLVASCSKGDDACLAVGDPVLFVHGFSLDDLGGGEDTWGDFPALLAEAGASPRYVPFEFRWNSSARFQDVAAELGSSVEAIALATGKQVHLVGHSFGGALIRTLLQGALAEDSRFAGIGNFVASVVTLGTPHSGIADAEQRMHGVAFPRGQDDQGAAIFDVFELCGQISCHQMGEPVFGRDAAELFGVETETGQVAAELAQLTANPLPSLDILALLGMTTPRFSNAVVDEGDGLITGWGQRFHPTLAVTDALAHQWADLASSGLASNSRVTERILGFADANMARVRPDAANPEPGNDGYRHTSSQIIFGATPEAYVDCGTRVGCGHDGLAETLAWLARYPAAMAPARPEIPLELRVVDDLGSPLAGATVRLMDDSALIDDATSGPQGRAALVLPFVAAERFTVYVSLDGFRSGIGAVRTFDVPSETPTQLGDVILGSNQPAFGSLAGTVVDALTGAPLVGASLTLTRIDQVTPARSGVSTADGGFATGDLLAARYVLLAELAGYEATERVIDILGGGTATLQVGLSPELQGDGALRIILTWDEDPSDLDSHLWKYRSDGSEEYHIFYASRQGTGGDFLDRDDTSSFGPETTTIQAVDPAARYVFAIFDFAGSGSIATTSQARVTVQFSNGSSRVFTPPAGGAERWWSVFEIQGGTIRPCNTGCLGDQPPAALAPWESPAAGWTKPMPDGR